ncbi:MAG: SDR family oxidoreductase [Flavobacteriales bacterium]|nr:SDR family oxidoreductase [Flavobacteriales bacterium]
MDLTLTGQRALVTGASQGIGRAVATELALLGASVTLLARDAGRLAATAATLDTAQGQKHATIAVDMSDTAALAESLSGLGPVDILVNNTGGPPPGLAHEADVEAFEQAFRLHLLAYQVLVRAVVPGMKERRHGRIINVISTSVKQPLPNLGVSNTVRGAVAQWSKTLANELGPSNITVNNVLPGATETERLAAIIRNKAGKSGVSEAEAAHEMMVEVPLRRFARPAEIAAAVAFLASPSGSYINGINLPVDGGRTGCL